MKDEGYVAGNVLPTFQSNFERHHRNTLGAMVASYDRTAYRLCVLSAAVKQFAFIFSFFKDHAFRYVSLRYHLEEIETTQTTITQTMVLHTKWRQQYSYIRYIDWVPRMQT